MPTYNVKIYNVDPLTLFPTGGLPSAGFVYTGPGAPTGTATIFDNSGNTDVFSDDDGGEGSTTGNVTVGGNTSSGVNVDNEMSWTLLDSVTGQTFQVAQLDVEGGAASGEYLLSEIPLVAGRAYTVQSYDSYPNSTDPSVFTYADYVESDGIVSGSGVGETIDVTYTGDPENDLIDSGGDPVDLSFNWTDEGGDETDLGNDFTQDTGGIDVRVRYTDQGPGNEYSVETTNQYVGAGEPFNDNSAVQLGGSGGGGGNTDTSITRFDFSAGAGSDFEDYVENVQFRVNDIDSGGWTDRVTIRAYDENGVLLTDPSDIIITVTGNDTQTGDTVTGANGGDDPDDADGSILVEIAGPVSRVEIDYDNLGSGGQALYVTDIHFQAIPIADFDDIVEAGGGNDIINAGLGADTVYGQAGDDTIQVGGGDTAFGDFSEGEGANNTGSDTFNINAAQLNGEDITIHGGEAPDDSDFDRLFFNGQLVAGSIVYAPVTDLGGGLSGTAELLDGTTVTFTGIEEIICFARGTRILTDMGEVAIEDLTPGQMVATLDDGSQPLRWIARRSVPATGKLAPIVFRAGVLGNTRDLRVSPQHRMLIRGAQAQLLFGEDEVLVAAKHLTNWDGVFTDIGGTVEYFHMMFDKHQIVFADGAASESFHPGLVGVGALEEDARAEVLHLFPELAADLGSYGPTARICLKRYEAQLLVH